MGFHHTRTSYSYRPLYQHSHVSRRFARLPQTSLRDWSLNHKHARRDRNSVKYGRYGQARAEALDSGSQTIGLRAASPKPGSAQANLTFTAQQPWHQTRYPWWMDVSILAAA